MIYFSIIQNNVFPNSYVELLEGSSEDTCRMHMMSLQKKLANRFYGWLVVWNIFYFPIYWE